jgi:hypothetical protein
MRHLLWIAAVVVLVVAMSAFSVPGWLLGVVVVATVALAIPLSIERYRRDRSIVRAIWRTLTAR